MHEPIGMGGSRMRLSGKVAVVTGAAQGIGASLAQGLAAAGAAVVAADIEECTRCVNAIIGAGGRAIGLLADVTSTASLLNVVRLTEEAYGPIDILVNNAGLFASLPSSPLMDIAEEEWDRVMRVNVRGTFQASKAVIPSMRRNGGGKIINIASATFFAPPPGKVHYVASKGAVIAMTRAMARELAQENILVNCIAPGLTETDSVRNNPAIERARGATIDARAIKRSMTPEDIVGALIFLASSDSDFMTGQMINIDGGRSSH